MAKRRRLPKTDARRLGQREARLEQVLNQGIERNAELLERLAK